MPTDVISKIGQTNTPTTMDYSTLQAWEDASPANLVSDDKRWIGECYNQGEIDPGGTGVALTISGETTDSTRYIILRTAAGASFKDHASVRSNALLYNSSNGVGITAQARYDSAMVVSVEYTRIQSLQVKVTHSSASYALTTGTTTTCWIDNCILQSACTGITRSVTPTKFTNCLFVATVASTSVFRSAEMYNCTAVYTGGSASGGFGGDPYAATLLKNCAFFNFLNTTSGGGLSASSDYNATDLASGGTNWGAHSLTSKTFANQFVSTSTDFRAKSGADLENAGTPDSTNAPTDISATTRSATTPTIGAWELAAAAGVTTAQEIPAFVQELSSQMVGLVYQ